MHDDWRPSSEADPWLGLRYDLDTNGNNADFEHPLVKAARRRHRQHSAATELCLGSAGDGRTVVRGGAGRFVGRLPASPPLELQFNGVTARTLPEDQRARVGSGSTPTTRENTGLQLAPDIILLDDEAPSPESIQAGLGAQPAPRRHRPPPRDRRGVRRKARTSLRWWTATGAATTTRVRTSRSRFACRIDPNYTQIERLTADGPLTLPGAHGRGQRHPRRRPPAVRIPHGGRKEEHLRRVRRTMRPSDPADAEAEWGRVQHRRTPPAGPQRVLPAAVAPDAGADLRVRLGPAVEPVLGLGRQLRRLLHRPRRGRRPQRPGRAPSAS